MNTFAYIKVLDMPLNIQENISLKSMNTFGLESTASHFVEVSTEEETLLALSEKGNYKDLFILGGGSNVLLSQDFDGLVIKVSSKGFEVIDESDDDVTVKVGAGEVWHDTVLNCIERGWAGIENMSLIPGTVGAAPMQNIGAYGVEIKKVFVSLEAIEKSSGEIKTFSKEECEFGYRQSVFKNALKDKYVITRVTLKLNKQPSLNIEYGDIKNTLEEMKITHPTIKDVSNAVISIRQSKLPNPAEIGNAGSFFKNPIISLTQFEEVKEKFPALVGYPAGSGLMKVAAGWMIDQAGWKGYRKGDIGVHTKQALVLVNYAQGKGKDIFALALEIKQSVKDKFGIDIDPEVNVI